MSTIAHATRELRDRVASAGLSYRKLAALAGVEDRTIAYFVRRGTANSRTLEKIEAALAKVGSSENAHVS